jgi:uncharacterized repeat protein (TIGR03803 family)
MLPPVSLSNPFSYRAGIAIILGVFFAIAMLATQPAHAQTYTVLHTFNWQPDGAFPYAGLTRGPDATFYGTTCQGGAGPLDSGFGVVYSIVDRAPEPIFTVLHHFHEVDGSCPVNRVVFGPDGALYGTTRFGGEFVGRNYPGWGTVFRLQPPPPLCVACGWSETVLYRFRGGSDGGNPEGDLIFDQAGNLYGTATQGGANRYGAVFQLHPSNGGWVENVLYSFTGFLDGGSPASGVILDEAGNLYGTAAGGSHQLGIIFELSPSGSGWTETVLHDFTGMMDDGAQPQAGLIPDIAGNLYGTTTLGGTENAGVAYELTPSNGPWIYQTLHSFTFLQSPSAGPADALFRDGAGNLYGTEIRNPAGLGGIFKLANSTWSEMDLHVFQTCDQGCEPTGSVLVDEHGNLYGTALTGSNFPGVIWKITP